jgi:hypothetical protein
VVGKLMEALCKEHQSAAMFIGSQQVVVVAIHKVKHAEHTHSSLLAHDHACYITQRLATAL